MSNSKNGHRTTTEAEAQSLMESVVALNKENLRRKRKKSDQANGKTPNGKKSKAVRGGETSPQVQSIRNAISSNFLG